MFVREKIVRDPYDPNEVGARVRMLRAAAGLSQSAFGKEIGATKNQVQQWESGNNRPAPDMIYAMIRRWNITSDWISYGIETNLGDRGEWLGLYTIVRRNGDAEEKLKD